MSILAFLPLLEFGKTIVDRFIPDPAKKAEAEMALLKMAQDDELKKIIGQLEINAKEATHPSVFVAGWRPGAGWVCVAGLAYQTILHNLLEWLSEINGWPTPPEPNTELLLYILGGLLGLGALRSIDKAKNSTKN